MFSSAPLALTVFALTCKSSIELSFELHECSEESEVPQGIVKQKHGGGGLAGLSLTGGLLGLGSAMATATAAGGSGQTGGGAAAETDDPLCEDFCKPRNSFLAMAGEFIASASQRLKLLSALVPDPQFKTPELFDNKAFIVCLSLSFSPEAVQIPFQSAIDRVFLTEAHGHVLLLFTRQEYEYFNFTYS